MHVTAAHRQHLVASPLQDPCASILCNIKYFLYGLAGVALELRDKMIDRQMQEHVTEVEGTGAGGGS